MRTERKWHLSTSMISTSGKLWCCWTHSESSSKYNINHEMCKLNQIFPEAYLLQPGKGYFRRFSSEGNGYFNVIFPTPSPPMQRPMATAFSVSPQPLVHSKSKLLDTSFMLTVIVSVYHTRLCSLIHIPRTSKKKYLVTLLVTHHHVESHVDPLAVTPLPKEKSYGTKDLVTSNMCQVRQK